MFIGDCANTMFRSFFAKNRHSSTEECRFYLLKPKLVKFLGQIKELIIRLEYSNLFMNVTKKAPIPYSLPSPNFSVSLFYNKEKTSAKIIIAEVFTFI